MCTTAGRWSRIGSCRSAAVLLAKPSLVQTRSSVRWACVSDGVVSDGVVNNWNNTQPESAISAGDRIISVDGLQGDPELMLNEL